MEADVVLAKQILSFGEGRGPEDTAFAEQMRQFVNDAPSGRVPGS